MMNEVPLTPEEKAGLKNFGQVTLLKYLGTLYGSLGGPIEEGRPGVVVLQLQDGAKKEHLVALEPSDAKEMVYHILRSLSRAEDPIAVELYDAFKGVFESRANLKEKSVVEQQPDATRRVGGH